MACGAGYVAAAARERGADATGVDFSAAQIRLAKQTYPGIRFVDGDAEALPFADGEFDAVLNAFGMPHAVNPDKVAAEAYRVLKPAGRFAYPSWCEPVKCIAFSMVYDAARSTWDYRQDPISSAVAGPITPSRCSTARDFAMWR